MQMSVSNKLSGNTEKLKPLKTLRNRSYMHTEIKSRFSSVKPATIRSRIVCLCVYQVIIYNNIHQTILRMLFCVGVIKWPLTYCTSVRECLGLLRKVFGSYMEE
jgi:hypothetical protein